MCALAARHLAFFLRGLIIVKPEFNVGRFKHRVLMPENAVNTSLYA